MGKLNSAEQNQQIHGWFCDLPWKQTDILRYRHADVSGISPHKALKPALMKLQDQVSLHNAEERQHDQTTRHSITQQKPDKSELKTNDWGIQTGHQREPPKHQRRSQQTNCTGRKKQIKDLQSDLFLCLLPKIIHWWPHKSLTMGPQNPQISVNI